MTRLVRTLPAFAPRPVFERTDSNLDAIRSIAFVPGTTDVIAIGRFGLQRFSLERDEPVWRVAGDGRWHAALAMSPDGERLLTIGDDDRLVERDAYTGAERWCWIEGLYHTCALAFSADGGDVVWAGSMFPGNPSGYSVPVVDLYDATTMQRRWRWEGESWRTTAGAAFVSRGILVSHSNGSLDVLERARGERVGNLLQTGSVRGSSDGHTVIVGDDVLDVLRDDVWVGQLPESGEVEAIAPDGSLAIIAPARELRLDIVALDPISVVASLAGTADDLDRVTAVAISERGFVATGTNGGHTVVYEL